MTKMIDTRCNNEAIISSLRIGGAHGHVEETITGDLLVLWRAPFCNWKPIRNCTGRYSCREKGKLGPMRIQQQPQQHQPPTIIPSHLSPLELMNHAYSCASRSHDSVLAGSNKSQEHCNVQEFDPAPGRKDRILVLPLDSKKTTGIITYYKEGDKSMELPLETPSVAVDDGRPYSKTPSNVLPAPLAPSRRYVHTLNAPSGFQRKLEAVGIQLAR